MCLDLPQFVVYWYSTEWFCYLTGIEAADLTSLLEQFEETQGE